MKGGRQPKGAYFLFVGTREKGVISLAGSQQRGKKDPKNLNCTVELALSYPEDGKRPVGGYSMKRIDRKGEMNSLDGKHP